MAVKITKKPKKALYKNGEIVELGEKEKKQEVVAVEASVTTQHKTGAEVEKKIPVGHIVKTEDMAEVGFSLSHTKNLGNYESLRVEVRITLPCKPDPKSLEEAYEFCSEFVNDKMSGNIDDIDE